MNVHQGPLRIEFASLTDQPYVLRDTVLYPNGPDQTAIELIWPTNGDPKESCINNLALLSNVTTRPGNGHYWANHIRIVNGWNVRLTGCNTIGPSGMPDPVSLNGVILDGKSTGVTIAHHRASGLATAIWIKGECEGTKVIDLDAVGVLNGIVAWPDTGGGEPGLWVTDSHINSTAWGIHLRHRYQVFLRDVLIYGGDYFAVTKGNAFYGLVCEDCQEVRLANVRVSRAGANGKPLVPEVFTRCQAVYGTAEQVKF